MKAQQYCSTGGAIVNKEKYEKTELEVIVFHSGDVILTSPPFEEDEAEMIPGH